ncbi:hypothetical protein EMCRGX_G016405 [Ephydatia muelleri]
MSVSCYLRCNPEPVNRLRLRPYSHSQSQRYAVQPQDVLAVCLRNMKYQAMVAFSVTGASVLRANSGTNPMCGPNGSMADTLDATEYNTILLTPRCMSALQM